MKLFYTLDEMLRECNIIRATYERPKITWDKLCYQDLIEYYYGNNNDENILTAIGYLLDQIHLRKTDAEDEMVIGEIWYDALAFPSYNLDSFHKLIYDEVLQYFELHTYLSYAITNITITHEHHPSDAFTGYRVVAHGNIVSSNEWMENVRNIYNQFFH